MTSDVPQPAPTTARQVTDPVCGMTVDPAATEHCAVHDGEHSYFCSAGCKDAFLAAPDAYAHPADEHDHAGHGTAQVHHTGITAPGVLS